MPSDLENLIARVERLEGPSREVDCAIAQCIIPDDWRETTDDIGKPMKINRAFYHQNMLMETRPTASLDAAIALCERVLPGEGIVLETHGKNRAGIGVSGKYPSSGATPAIALCLATLRALAAQGKEGT